MKCRPLARRHRISNVLCRPRQLGQQGDGHRDSSAILTARVGVRPLRMLWKLEATKTSPQNTGVGFIVAADIAGNAFTFLLKLRRLTFIGAVFCSAT